MVASLSIAMHRDAHGTSSRGDDASLRVVRDGERYEVLGELATGGMATVYLGRMRRPMGFARLVAIKCMHPQYAKDPSFASMFVDEARLTARLRHPNIVPTLDIVSEGRHLLIVMEYVDGESLAGLLRLVREKNDRIPVGIACAIIHDLLLGLHEAHEAKDDDGQPLAIIHRDVSPQNVIVGLDGLARVLDFGVAKARSRVHCSNEGEVKGKIPYMPPEQLFGEGVDRRVDVYAAGVLLWEALTGQRLFDGPSEEILVRRIDEGAAVPPSTHAPGVSTELDALVLRALSKDADGRFATALEMAEALSRIATLPPRTEISAWMRRFASARAIPSTALGPTSDLTDDAARADSIVKVLERHTVVSRVSRTSIVPVETDVSVRETAPSRKTSRLAMLVGIASFVLGGVVVGRAMRAETAHAAPAHHAAAAEAPVASAPVSAPVTTAAPPAVAEPAATTTSARPAPARAARPHGKRGAAAAAPAKAGGEPVTTTTTPAPPAADAKPDAKSGSCKLPYVVDAEGHRHYKVECL